MKSERYDTRGALPSRGRGTRPKGQPRVRRGVAGVARQKRCAHSQVADTLGIATLNARPSVGPLVRVSIRWYPVGARATDSAVASICYPRFAICYAERASANSAIERGLVKAQEGSTFYAARNVWWFRRKSL